MQQKKGFCRNRECSRNQQPIKRLFTKFQPNPLTQSDWSKNASNLQQNAAFYSKLAIFGTCTVSTCVLHPKKLWITKFHSISLTQSDFRQNATNLQQNVAFYSKLPIFEMCTISRSIPHPKKR